MSDKSAVVPIVGRTHFRASYQLLRSCYGPPIWLTNPRTLLSKIALYAPSVGRTAYRSTTDLNMSAATAYELLKATGTSGERFKAYVLPVTP